MRGLRTKLDLVKNNIKILTPEPDIIILTETWLCQDINDNEIGLLGNNIVRKDRYNFSAAPCGGGVLIAIKDKFTFDIITNNNIESLFQEDSNVSSFDDNLSEETTRNQFSVDIEKNIYRVVSA